MQIKDLVDILTSQYTPDEQAMICFKDEEGNVNYMPIDGISRDEISSEDGTANLSVAALNCHDDDPLEEATDAQEQAEADAGASAQADNGVSTDPNAA